MFNAIDAKRLRLMDILITSPLDASDEKLRSILLEKTAHAGSNGQKIDNICKFVELITGVKIADVTPAVEVPKTPEPKPGNKKHYDRKELLALASEATRKAVAHIDPAGRNCRTTMPSVVFEAMLAECRRNKLTHDEIAVLFGCATRSVGRYARESGNYRNVSPNLKADGFGSFNSGR